MSTLRIPDAPNSIMKGVPLKMILDVEAVTQLARNLSIAGAKIDEQAFIAFLMKNIEELGIKDRGNLIGDALHHFLPKDFSENADLLLKSLTPPLERTEDNGLAPMFYMPHCAYVGKYGVDEKYNNGKDPFDVAMQLQYELTKRFTCEFSIRPFIAKDQERTMILLYKWMLDKDPHVRRLCSEGTRPRLPWATKLGELAKDPSPSLKILETLKDDPDLYVRRSVANHIGDIAKDHLDLALDICEDWIKGASKERKWVIRHAVRNPIKKGNERAAEIRAAAK